MKNIVLEELVFSKEPVESFLVEYNQFISKIYVDHFSDIRFRSSSIFNKLEAQSHFYQRLLMYKRAIDLLKDQNIELTVNDVVVGNALKKDYSGRIVTGKKNYTQFYFLKRFIFYFCLTIFFKILSQFKGNIAKKYDSVIRTYFVSRSISASTGELRDEYLSAFADDLFIQEKVLVVFKNLDWHDWKKFGKAKDSKKFDFCFAEHLLSCFDIVKIFSKFYLSKINYKEKTFYQNIDITNLLTEALDEEYVKIGSLVYYVEEVVAAKVIALKPKFIFFPFENQAWEKSYPYMRKQLNSNVRVVGFQHTGVSYKLLNYFPSVLEKDLPIYPEIIFTVGQVIKNILEEKAFFNSKIMVAGAIRHSHFVKNGFIRSQAPRLKLNYIVTYAFSYDFSLYNKILIDLNEVFGGTKIKVYLKFHPLFSDDYLNLHFGKFYNENLILGTNITWPEIYDTADVILYDDNTIGFEGMVKGVKTYLYKDAESYYDCKRDYYFDVWKHELDKNDLKTIKNSLLDGTYNKDFNQCDLDNYLKEYFKPYVVKFTITEINQKLVL